MDEAELQSRLPQVTNSVVIGFNSILRSCEESLLESIKTHCRNHGGNLEECTNVIKEVCKEYCLRMCDSMAVFQHAIQETLQDAPPAVAPIATTVHQPEEEKLLMDEIKELEIEIRKNQGSIREALEQSRDLKRDETLLGEVRGALLEKTEALLKPTSAGSGDQLREEAVALQRKTKAVLEEIEGDILAQFETATAIQREMTQQKTKEYLLLAHNM